MKEVKVIKVIQVIDNIGNGTTFPVRQIKRLYNLKGNCITEIDTLGLFTVENMVTFANHCQALNVPVTYQTFTDYIEKYNPQNQ